MFASATSGTKSNNDNFSPCSIRSIASVLNSVVNQLNGKTNCFAGEFLYLYHAFYIFERTILFTIFVLFKMKYFASHSFLSILDVENRVCQVLAKLCHCSTCPYDILFIVSSRYQL